MIRYFYQNVVIWLLHFFYYFLQDCTVGIEIIMSVNWRSKILVNIYFSSAWYINSICYTVGFTSLMTFICDWKTSNLIPQEIQWKLLNILLTLSYNTMTGLPTSHKTTAAYGDENHFSSSCWSVCYWQTALWSILWVYISSNYYYYILLFL